MFKVIGILLICFLVILSACEQDIGFTDQLLLKEDPDALVDTPAQIPDWLKSKLWGNQDALIEELLALDEDDIQTAIVLSNQIASRMEQDTFYKKWINAGGVAIIGTTGISDIELEIARDIVLTMTDKEPELRQFLHYDTGFYIVLFDRLSYNFSLPLLPEAHTLYANRSVIFPFAMCNFGEKVCFAPSGGKNIGGQVIETRVRYQGKTCREMGWQTDNYWCYQDGGKLVNWDAFIHEFAHAIHYAIASSDSEAVFSAKLVAAYENAIAKNLWTIKGKRFNYASKSATEYWAVGSEVWFIPIPASDIPNADGELAPEISQRTLKDLDPKLYRLLSECYLSTEFISIE